MLSPKKSMKSSGLPPASAAETVMQVAIIDVTIDMTRAQAPNLRIMPFIGINSTVGNLLAFYLSVSYSIQEIPLFTARRIFS